MYGAILGDMIGAPYEFDMGDKTKTFPLFIEESQFTDDSVMTVAVAEALMDAREKGVEKDEPEVKKLVAASMRLWGMRYPFAGYGGRFIRWLFDPKMGPYGSYGNGSAMRVSAAGWLYDDLETTRRIARWTAEVTHDHPEGVRGAEAAACAVFLARNRKTKDEIRAYIVREFGYDLSRTCDEIRPDYHHVESCQETVPEAITAFLEGTDFEDVIRTAVSLGGDCDTLTCIAGGIAEAFYGIPLPLKLECRKRMESDMVKVLMRFVTTVRKIRKGYCTPEEYGRMDPEEISAFSLAEGGAMGCPNEVILVRRNSGSVEFLLSSADTQLRDLFPWMDRMRMSPTGQAWDLGEGWEHIDLGMGNHLFLRQAVCQNILPRFKGMSPGMIYQAWSEAVAEALSDME